LETFFFGILVALGPSVAALAWFIWYSSASENSDREERSESDEIRVGLFSCSDKSVRELPAAGGLVVVELAEVRLGRHR
jgi:hypothetical protein